MYLALIFSTSVVTHIRYAVMQSMCDIYVYNSILLSTLYITIILYYRQYRPIA